MAKKLKEDMEKNLPERVFDEIPTGRNSAITSGEIQRRIDEPSVFNMSSVLIHLYTSHRIKREKIGVIFVYWRDTNKEEDRGNEISANEMPTATEFILDILPLDKEHSLSLRNLALKGGGKYSYSGLHTQIHKLFNKGIIKRVWDGRAFCYWHDKSKWKDII